MKCSSLSESVKPASSKLGLAVAILTVLTAIAACGRSSDKEIESRNVDNGGVQIDANYGVSDWRNVDALCDVDQKRSQRASSFGCYKGYSNEKYDSFIRESIYVPMRDGVELAVDIFRPTVNGEAVETPLPVIVNYSRYWRAYEFSNGVVSTALGELDIGQAHSSIDEAISRRANSDEARKRNERPDNKGYGLLLAHGYVVVKAEARGTGASFGIFHGDMSGIEANDGHDLIEWASKQPWSDGKIGMVGQSYEGMVQYLVTSTAPKHLAAIMPNVGTFDEYRVAWAGTGILRKYGIAYLTYVTGRDGTTKSDEKSKINAVATVTKSVGRVDADIDGAIREKARAERLQNKAAGNPFTYFMRQSPEAGKLYSIIGESLGSQSPLEILEVIYSTELLDTQLKRDPTLREKLNGLRHYRDGADIMVNPQPSGPNNLAILVDQVRSSGVPVYNWGSWFDYQATDQVLWYANLGSNAKLTMGPWSHNQNEPDDVREDASHTLRRIEQLRWMDYWLKGIANGIAKEPPVTAAVSTTDEDFSWLQASQWPAPYVQLSQWYVGEDSALSTEFTTKTGRDKFTVDYYSSMGEHTRYHDAIGLGPLEYTDLDEHLKTGALAFTSAPFKENQTILGSPIAKLFVTSTTPDADVHAYFQKIDEAGNVSYQSDAVLRASHRVLGQPPYNNMGLPWSDSSREVVNRTPGMTEDSPVQLEFYMHPIGVKISKGERIRLVVTGADSHTNLTIPQDPASVLGINYGEDTPSSLALPLVQAGMIE